MRLPFGLAIEKRDDGTFLTRRPREKKIEKRSATSIPHRRPAPSKRWFDAAQGSNLTYTWTNSPVTADQMLLHGLSTLRARSRDQVINNDYGRRFVSLVKGHVVGPDGIVMQAKSKYPNGKLDVKANVSIEEAWTDWMRAPNASMSGTETWLDLQKLYIGAVAEDGEAIFQKVYGKRAGKYNFALHQLDPERLDVRYNEVLANGHIVRLGIEFDEWYKPLAYNFKHDGEGSYLATNGHRYLRIAAKDIIHGFLKERVNQSRGVPWMTASLLRMQMLGAFEEAALVNARVGASKVGVITSPPGTSFKGDSEDPVTGEQLMDAEPGTVLDLVEGQTVSGWDPAYPNGEFDIFTKRILQGMSAGLQVDYPGFSGDLEGVNFSSIRAGVLETRESWKALQAWMIEKFNRPIFEAWLECALLSELIQINGKPLKYSRYEKYKRAAFQPRRWPWVDPLKDLKAAELAIELGLASRSEFIRERGGNPVDVWDEKQREDEQMADRNIHLGKEPATEVEDTDKKSAKDKTQKEETDAK